MKSKLLLSVSLLAALLFFSGCATPQTEYGKKEVSILGGLVSSKQGAYERTGPLSISERSSTIDPGANLDGDKISLLWGLISFTDD